MKKIFMISLALWASVSFAAENEQVRLVTLPGTASSRDKSSDSDKVAIIPVKLSPEMIALQNLRSQEFNAPRSLHDHHLPSHVDLGMNGVPVLDQGQHGTCATFAATAAIDAALGEGDFISQLCLLQLSSYLSDFTYWGNAWTGSLDHKVLGLIREYGVISKQDQKKGICNSINDYPLDGGEFYYGLKLSPIEYHKYSYNVLSNAANQVTIEPQVLFHLADMTDIHQSGKVITISNTSDHWVTPAASLAAVRKSLSEGNRVIIGYLIKPDEFFQGHNKTDLDTWFASKTLKTAFKVAPNATQWGGHAIILYGYDDNAVVRNAKGEMQKGVLYVRNSWGTKIPPNKGVEFMTYDYFKLMAIGAYSLNTKVNPS